MMHLNRSFLAGCLVAAVFSAQVLVAQPGPGDMPPPPVNIVVAERRNVPVVYEFVSLTEPSKTVEVRARIRGFLEARHFTEGAFVKEGDLLYTIDKRTFLTDVEFAKARVEQAEARVRTTEREFKRWSDAVASNAAPSGEVDRAQGDLDEARAALRVAKAELERANTELSYTEVRAPISGLIGRTLKEVGSLVDDFENSHLATVTAITPIHVTASLSEREYLTWKKDGDSGQIRMADGKTMNFILVFPDGSSWPEPGKLNFEDVAFRPETGTYRVRAEFPNAKSILKPGQFLKTKVTGWERPNVIALPQRAVTQSPMGPLVMIIGEGDTVQPRPVTLGPWTGSEWIITSGVEPGERVMVDGMMKGFPGSKVTPELLGSDAAKTAEAPPKSDAK